MPRKDTKWSSEQFDDVYKKHRLESETLNPGSDSKSFSSSEHIQKIPAVPPYIFKEMGAESDDEIEYMVVSDPKLGGGFWKAHHKITTPFPEADPDAKQRSAEVLENLRPWEPEDLQRLGLAELLPLFDFDESDGISIPDEDNLDESDDETTPTNLEFEQGDDEDPDMGSDGDIRIPGVDF